MSYLYLLLTAQGCSKQTAPTEFTSSSVQRPWQRRRGFAPGSRLVSNSFMNDISTRLLRVCVLRRRFCCLFLALCFLFRSHPFTYIVYFHFNPRRFSSKHCVFVYNISGTISQAIDHTSNMRFSIRVALV